MKTVYLVRNLEKGLVTMEMRKPDDIEFPPKGVTWWYKGNHFHIGELSVYAADRNFSGTIGVFDIDKPGQLRKLLEAYQAETRALLEHQIMVVLDSHGLRDLPNLPPPSGPGGTHRSRLAIEIARIFSPG
jgi:hypothetical protein